MTGRPRIHLAQAPTPIEELPRLREALNAAPRLFVKRDDYTGPGLGGNKVRKLEYVLAEALARGADTVLTIGNLRSNHARITAALCARLGLECHLVLSGIADDVPASLFLDELFGAEVHRVATSSQRMPAMQALGATLRTNGRKTYEIPLGASDALGALGYVHCAEEIAQQSLRFAAIFVCSSSGGTQAGLDAGLQLHGLGDAALIGVSPDDAASQIGPHVAEIRAGVGELLGRDFARPLVVDDRFVGEGYGIPTEESREAIRLLARTEGLLLDPTYTSKAMASLLHRVRAGEFGPQESVLFIHTGGQAGLFSARDDLRLNG